jgi:PAS domain S-box-containing protein
LQELRQQFNDFLYFLPDALLEVDLLAPRLTYMNRMAYIVFGYTEADFAAGIEISSLFAEGECERAVRIITGYVGDSLGRKAAYTRSGKQDLYEFLMRRKDGSVFHAETQTSFVLGEDRIPIRMRTLIRDVTARKQAEEAKREQETWLRLVIEQLPALLWTTDAGLRITSSAGAGLVALNLRPNQTDGMTLFEYFQNQAQDFFPIVAHRRALAGESITYEHEWSGNCYQIHLEPLRDAQGRIVGCIGIAQDITALKRAQQELQENEALYHALFETVPVGLGIADLDGKLLAFNESMLKPGGYTHAEIEQVGNVARLYYDLEERKLALALAQQQGYLDRHEVRFKSKDGSPYHTLLSLRPILIKGKPCWQAVVEDITARKRAEEALQKAHAELELRVRERTAELLHTNTVLEEQIAERKCMEVALRRSEERYRALYEDNPSMCFTVDTKGTVLAVNRFGAEQLGYEVTELLEKSVLDVFHEEDKPSVQQHLAACLENTKQTFHWEVRKVHKNGSLLWVREAARAVQDANGKPWC